MNNNIDIVIPWVDDSDPLWKKEKEYYSEFISNDEDASDIRFRGMDNLRYVFRGIERNAQWVNKVYFITYGHLPEWLNLNHPKLKIVNHTDYIPKEYLPTFLMDTAPLTAGAESPDKYMMSMIVTIVTAIICMVLSVFVFNKKDI